MRRKDRAVTAPAQILSILKECKVCRLAMIDEQGAYLVPLNFGYAVNAQGEALQLTLYFHSAAVGRKISAMKQNPRVCFEMDCEHRLIEGEQLTDYSYRFKSIIGSGNVCFIEDETARMGAMLCIMQHQTGLTVQELTTMPYEEKWMGKDALAVFSVTVGEFEAKFHP